jgi:uncharacterized membrane protein YvbJ
MFCEGCGKNIPDNAKFCHHCGQKQWESAEGELQGSGAQGKEQKKPERSLESKVAIGILIAVVVIAALYFFIDGLSKFSNSL